MFNPGDRVRQGTPRGTHGRDGTVVGPSKGVPHAWKVEFDYDDMLPYRTRYGYELTLIEPLADECESFFV